MIIVKRQRCYLNRIVKTQLKIFFIYIIQHKEDNNKYSVLLGDRK